MSDNVVSMDSHRFPWEEILSVDNECNTLRVYANKRTGEIEVSQDDDFGKSIRTIFDPIEAGMLVDAITKVCNEKP